MDPLTIGIVGAMSVGAVVNAYNAEKARGADRQRLKEIRSLFEKIKPPDYDVSIDAPPEYHEQVLAQPRFSDPAQAPKFDTSRLTPEDLKIVGKYTPELAPYIAEQNPELVRQSQQAMQGRDAQRKALERYMAMGDTGDDAISAQAAFNARQQAGMDTRGRQQALEQSFARRGQLGAGMQFAGEMQAGQAAGNQQALAQMQAASDAQRRRLEALASGASLGGQIYGQEMNLADKNASIINDFNRRMASTRQDYENRRALSMNEAQRTNLANEQDVANRNVMNRNRAQESNLDRSDSLTKYGAEWARGERNRSDDIERERYAMSRGERGFQNDIAERKANWAAKQRADRNRIAGQQFDDQYKWASAMGGALGMERSAARERDVDRATQVQGATNIATSGLEGWQRSNQYDRQQTSSRKQWGDQQMADDDRQYYDQNGNWMSPEERKRRRSIYD
jgi:hypothetical protein